MVKLTRECSKRNEALKKVILAIAAVSLFGGQALGSSNTQPSNQSKFAPLPVPTRPPPTTSGSTMEQYRPPIIPPGCGMSCPSPLDNPAIDLPHPRDLPRTPMPVRGK